jgi:hypothetical protein
MQSPRFGATCGRRRKRAGLPPAPGRAPRPRFARPGRRRRPARRGRRARSVSLRARWPRFKRHARGWSRRRVGARGRPRGAHAVRTTGLPDGQRDGQAHALRGGRTEAAPYAVPRFGATWGRRRKHADLSRVPAAGLARGSRGRGGGSAQRDGQAGLCPSGALNRSACRRAVRRYVPAAPERRFAHAAGSRDAHAVRATGPPVGVQRDGRACLARPECRESLRMP